ncbi:MAG: DM13 domain-containing protein [Bacteroidota bacterium]
MKKLFIAFLILISFSCSEDENNTPTAPINDNFDPGQATLLKQGTLMGVGHTVSGTVKAYDSNSKITIVLDPFSSQNGPDLKVYLSKDENASQYINLGALKSTTGKQSYDVTGMPNLDEYKFVLVWCQQFSVLFGKAELQ